MPISKETATDIALAYREIATAEQLLTDITEAAGRYQSSDIRDVFGRRVEGLQLGVPNGKDSQRLFMVPWSMARPIIQAHIAQRQAELALLNEKARIELDAVAPPAADGGAA